MAVRQCESGPAGPTACSSQADLLLSGAAHLEVQCRCQLLEHEGDSRGDVSCDLSAPVAWSAGVDDCCCQDMIFWSWQTAQQRACGTLHPILRTNLLQDPPGKCLPAFLHAQVLLPLMLLSSMMSIEPHLAVLGLYAPGHGCIHVGGDIKSRPATQMLWPRMLQLRRLHPGSRTCPFGKLTLIALLNVTSARVCCELFTFSQKDPVCCMRLGLAASGGGARQMQKPHHSCPGASSWTRASSTK